MNAEENLIWKETLREAFALTGLQTFDDLQEIWSESTEPTPPEKLLAALFGQTLPTPAQVARRKKTEAAGDPPAAAEAPGSETHAIRSPGPLSALPHSHNRRHAMGAGKNLRAAVSFPS